MSTWSSGVRERDATAPKVDTIGDFEARAYTARSGSKLALVDDAGCVWARLKVCVCERVLRRNASVNNCLFGLRKPPIPTVENL